MPKNLLLLIAFCLIAVTSQAQEAKKDLTVTLGFQNDILLKLESPNKYKKVTMSGSTTEELYTTTQMHVQNTKDMPDDGRALSLELLGNNKVRYIDEGYAIDQVVPVSIDRSSDGSIDIIEIRQKDYGGLFDKALEDMYKTLLKQWSIKDEEITEAEGFALSFKCEPSEIKNHMKCKREAVVSIDFRRELSKATKR